MAFTLVTTWRLPVACLSSSLQYFFARRAICRSRLVKSEVSEVTTVQWIATADRSKCESATISQALGGRFPCCYQTFGAPPLLLKCILCSNSRKPGKNFVISSCKVYIRWVICLQLFFVFFLACQAIQMAPLPALTWKEQRTWKDRR